MKDSKVYKENLTIEQKINYEILLKGITACKESIHIMETNIDTLNMIIEAIRKDITSLFYVGTFRYSISNLYSTITPQYLYQKNVINRFNNDIHTICEQLDKLVTGKTEWEKVLYIHDWLCEQIRYSDIGPESHTIIGALINHSAVCEGIAKSAKLLFDYVGIDSCVVLGKSTSIANNNHIADHAWNKVNVNNRWYNIDITFDNTLSKGKLLRHDYFLLSDKNIYIDHEELYNSGIKCFDDDQSYYAVKKLVMSSQQMFYLYLKRKIQNGDSLVEFKLPSAKEPSTVYKSVLEIIEQVLKELKLYKQIKIDYNEKQLVFTVSIF